tara:strand:+ start:1308 stop:1658 length:351 start_codon:yes stop_codon:yes gene_type:complete
MRLVTRGLGGGQDVGLVLQGFTFAEKVIIRALRGGRTVAKDLYENFKEEFTIAAKLIEINGKELIRPIINKRTYTVDDSTDVTVTAAPKSVENKKQNIFSVIAETIKIKRGSDGSN